MCTCKYIQGPKHPIACSFSCVACVLGEVEAALKKKLCELYQENLELFLKRYQVKDYDTDKELPVTALPAELGAADLHVYLADFVDIVSGEGVASSRNIYNFTKGVILLGRCLFKGTQLSQVRASP